MKTFEGKLHLWCVVIVIIATLLLAVGRVAAETDPIPNVYLNFSKTSYDLDSSENIKAYITFANLLVRTSGPIKALVIWTIGFSFSSGGRMAR